MEAEVVKLDAALIEDLKRRRILRDQAKSVDLDPVGPNETPIGVLTTEEQELFCELFSLSNERIAFNKELTARSLEMVAKALRDTPEDKMQEIQQNFDLAMVFPTDDDAEEFFSLESRIAYIRALYDTSVRDRYGHRAVYGVRQGFTVVRIAYKHRLPDDVRKKPS